MKKDHSLFGYDAFYDFDNDGKLDPLEAAFQLHGEMMENHAIANRHPLNDFSKPVSALDLHDDKDDLDDDLDDDF